MTLRPLPRSLAPLTDESLPGYLLRLGHRLDLPPARLAAVTGLTKLRAAAIPASRMLALSPALTETFAYATRLSTSEVTGLTLVSLATRYPPVDLRFSGRERLPHGVFVKENWIFARSTRYCPDCLAGDDSTIQQRHGGAWSKLWRLPVVFACPTHRRLLEHTCPACGQPVHLRASGGQLLPRADNAILHPAACRNVIPASNRDRARVCGHRLDQHISRTPVGSGQLARFLDLQARILDLLRPDGSVSTSSVGQPATPANYIIDLRILACLVTASWPAARPLAPSSIDADRVDEHARAVRRQFDQVRRDGRVAREIAFHDKPSLVAAPGASLLTIADRIITAGGPSTVRRILLPMLQAAPRGTRIWVRQFLRGDGFCSPGMQAAAGPDVGARHVINRTGVPPASRRPATTEHSGPLRFGVQHVPQRPRPEWLREYFADFTDLTPRLLRNAVVVRLAQASAGDISVTHAATLLGLPADSARYAVKTTRRQLETATRRDAFDTAIYALTDHLNTTTDLVDYGRRRDTLRAWSIAPDEWENLTAGLIGQPINGRAKPHTHWGDGKRILASVWIWTRITGGEHIFAAPIRPDPTATRPGGHLPHYVHHRWRFIDAARPGHYSRLRQRLDVYADQLTHSIDVAT
jgi:hypothetical protein